MLGAIYIGLSGMNAYSKGLQTLSNNVANLNSPGFKTATLEFSDLFNRGNPGLGTPGSLDGSQYGAGVRYDSSMTNFLQGDLRQTGSDLDLAIQGGGFLVLLDGSKQLYARTGQFGIDNDGYVIEQGTTKRLAILGDGGNLAPVTVEGKRTNAPIASTVIKFADNLSSTAPSHTLSNIVVYDSNGGQHTWTVQLTAQGSTAPGKWDLVVKDENSVTLKTDTLSFIGSSPDPSNNKIVVDLNPTNSDPLSVTLDFSNGVTSFSSGTTSTLRVASVDGNAVGALTAVTVDEGGELKITYSNQKTELLGHIAIADFLDPQKLEQIGEGVFRNSGSERPRLLKSESEGIGKLVSKQLEASNVDLSKEFGDLILVQRGFQASSQVVSIANDMIQQLFGIKGQS